MRINAVQNRVYTNRTQVNKSKTNNIKSVLITNNIKQNSGVSFGATAGQIELEFARRGIIADFRGNHFLADCTKRITDVFESVFGKLSLPKSIDYLPLEQNTAGEFNILTERITFNSLLQRFDNMEYLKKAVKSSKNFILPDEHSTIHPASDFTHEFGHCAHKAHLKARGHDAVVMMLALRKTQVPTSIGKLIVAYKLGKYSLDQYGGMNEFMAERVSQDVCKGLTKSWMFGGDKKDCDYENIFNNRWNCRYSTPQAYLDYFTQQVWNGDIDGAQKVAGDVEIFLKEIERKNYFSEKKQDTISGMWDRFMGSITKQSDFFDKRNRIKFNV